jgi:hypothetical protein
MRAKITSILAIAVQVEMQKREKFHEFFIVFLNFFFIFCALRLAMSIELLFPHAILQLFIMACAAAVNVKQQLNKISFPLRSIPLTFFSGCRNTTHDVSKALQKQLRSLLTAAYIFPLAL